MQNPRPSWQALAAKKRALNKAKAAYLAANGRPVCPMCSHPNTACKCY